MSMHRSLATALWLLAALGTYALAASWAGDAQIAKVHPWALVALFWGVALVSAAIHHLSRFLSDLLAEAADVLARCGARHKATLHRYAGSLPGRLAEGLRVSRRFWARYRPSLHALPELLRGSWTQHRVTADASGAIPAAGNASPGFAARLGALIGVR